MIFRSHLNAYIVICITSGIVVIVVAIISVSPSSPMWLIVLFDVADCPFPHDLCAAQQYAAYAACIIDGNNMHGGCLKPPRS